MEDHQEQINRLQQKLEQMVQRQDGFGREIKYLRWEINQLRTKVDQGASPTPVRVAPPASVKKPPSIAAKEVVTPEYALEASTDDLPSERPVRPAAKLPKVGLDLEKFIGENLISKIGIAITVIGVAIGAKYSIEHNLINPLTRIILGYLAGLALLGVGIRLKTKYESYSAVLVSGAMTIMYFITYMAYGMYDLLPQTVAFLLMVIFTIFTVLAALNYNRQLIALIGLVGAYAVPFLLSENTGGAAILFTYTAIINIGILVIAFRKYWKVLYHTAFGLTWLMFVTWLAFSFRGSEHFGLAIIFVTIFFLIFYVTFLAYKLIRKEQFGLSDIALLLINSFLFYGLGYTLLASHGTYDQLLGVFTLGNALLHFGVAMTIKQQDLANKKLLYLVAGLVLVFITITVPVQLDGSWVTLLWTAEAALLFWIGRTKQVEIYERIAYPLMLLALLSIGQDWNLAYSRSFAVDSVNYFKPVFNIHFLSSLLFVLAFGFITWVNRNHERGVDGDKKTGIVRIMRIVIPVILVFALYNTFRLEIAYYWDNLYQASLISNPDGDGYPMEYRNNDLRDFKTVWLINYTLLFLSILSLVNIEKLKSRNLGLINLGLNVLVILAFLVAGLYALSELRVSYLQQALVEYYDRGVFYLIIRYVSYLFVVLALAMTWRYVRRPFMVVNLRKAFELFLHLSILWIMSSELLHWMDIADAAQSYKLGLSILWGTYALMLIAIGIWKNKQHLRIGAIALFGVTLVKLFVYDISHLDTIAKTIVFVSLGVLLLIISFLYNKYKHLIADETDH